MEHMFQFIKFHTTQKWAQKFLIDLKKAYDPAPIAQYLKIGMGLKWFFIKSKQGCKELNVSILEDHYLRSKKRLIMIDQDGVIPMKQKDGRNNEPTNEIVSALNELSMDP
jgi:trehalose 6-phosphate synthase/phosphatase